MMTLIRRSASALAARTGRFSQNTMLILMVSFGLAVSVAPAGAFAQNLGTAPAVNQAVQGQNAAQPEGAFLNVVNWIGNVICPVGAVLAIVATVVQWRSGRGWMPSAVTAGGLLMVSGLSRLVEYFIQNGNAVG